MARFARAVLVDVPHHLTQRGVNRQQVFADPVDYQVYLDQVCTHAEYSGTAILGYCCMPNHVHWVVIPRAPDALARTFGAAHGRYAAYANARLGRSGHLWQNRFFSCPLDANHLWSALRYVERNPVRAGLVATASHFRWSSAAAHAGLDTTPGWLRAEPFRSTFTAGQWAAYLDFESQGEADNELRRHTHTGRPLGTAEFVAWAEKWLDRRLAPQRGGAKKKAALGVI